MRVLIIEEDRCTAEEIKESIRPHRFHADISSALARGCACAMENNYGAIIIADALGRLNVQNGVRRIRIGGVTAPIIIIGKNMSIETMREYFLAGANDFLNAPPSMQLLLLRLKINTQSETDRAPAQYLVGDAEFFPHKHILRTKGCEVVLTKKESELLELLIVNQRLVLTKEQIINRVWCNNPLLNENNIEVHISNLRKKLKQVNTRVRIETVRNAGYSLCI